MTYCCFSHEAGFQPLFDAVQVQVDADQAQLPSSLDQLVWFHHQPLREEDEDFGITSAGPTGFFCAFYVLFLFRAPIITI